MRRVFVLTLALLLSTGCSENETPEDQESAQSTSTSSTGNSGGSAQPGSEGFESPEAAFEAVKSAALNDDFPGAIRCMTPQSQEVMAMMMSIPLAMMAAFDPDKKPEVEALMSRHGLSIDDESQELPMENIPDRIAFITDVLEFMEANSDGEDDGSPISKMAEATLKDLTIDGDQAKGMIHSNEGETEEIEFARIDGRWFVQIPDPMSGMQEGSSHDMSFDESFGGSGFTGFGTEVAPPITAVSMEEFGAAWQVTLNVTEAEAAELLSQFADELGLAMSGNNVSEALKQSVTVSKSGVSRFEVIEAICTEIGVTPVYGETELTFLPSARQTPVAFAGPFAVFVRDLMTDSETATGELLLHVVASGIPETVLRQMEEGFSDPLTILGVMDSSGESLENPAETGISYTGDPLTSFDREVFIGLRNLLRNVESIGSVELDVEFSMPTSVEVLTFDDLKPDTTQKAADGELTLTEVDGAAFTFEYSGISDGLIQLIGYDADDEAMAPFSSSTFGGGDSGQIAYEYEESPVRFEARVVTASETLSYSLMLSEIALSDHALMPEELPKLEFEGSTPVTLEFVRLEGQEGFREAVFRAQNVSNKPIRSIDVMMSYQNNSGEELENQEMQWNGETIAAGAESEITVAAYFMPDEATKVVGTATSVTLTDASTWEKSP